MNTEQLKTAEEILKQQMIKLLKKEQPEWTDKEVEEMVEDDLASETDFVEHFIEGMQIFASQESKRAVDEALIDKDFIIYCLNQSWNYAHEQLQKKDIGDIERDIYQKQKDKAKALMTKLDSLT